MGGDINALSLVLTMVLIYLGFRLWRVKGVSYDYRYLYRSTIITVIVFLYLFFISLIYWFLDNKAKPFDYNELIFLRHVAKSAHFAANAIINPTLYNLSGYSEEILEWIKCYCGVQSFSYISTGISLLIAPICTAAWLITLLSRGFLENLIVIIGRGKIGRFVFYDPTAHNIELAKCLRQTFKKRSFIFCNSEQTGRVISEGLLSSIHSIRGYFFNGLMKDLALKENDTLILFFDSLDRINEQDIFGLERKIDKNRVIVIANDSEEYIRFVFDSVINVNNLKAISYLEKVAAIIVEEQQKESGYSIIITDKTIADSIKKRMNGECHCYLLEKDQTQSRLEDCNSSGEFKHWKGNEIEIEKQALNLINNTFGINRLFIAYEDVKENIEIKRQFSKLFLNKNLNISVYCNDLRLENIEKNWDENKGVKEKVEYIGRNDLIISKLVDDCIEFNNDF